MASVCSSTESRRCRIGIAVTGVRWNTATCAATFEASWTTWTPLAPVPMIAILRSASGVPSCGQAAVWWHSPSNRSRPGNAGTNVNVTRRRVQVTVSVEIFDQRQGRMLWQRSGLSVDGEYQPPQEPQGRKVALEKLVNDIVDGAQSQW